MLPVVGTILALLVLAVVSERAVGLVRSYALRNAMLDLPTHRSSHDQPTPRGAGVVIAVAIPIAAAVAWALDLLTGRVALAFIEGCALLGLIGWIDDRRSVSPAIRFAVHVIAATVAVACISGFPRVGLGVSSLEMGAAGSVVAVLGLVWLTNLYNFMDGIDGLAGVTAALVGSFAVLALSLSSDWGLMAVALAVAGTSLGFLRWNWQPARIFMGDVGSGVLGFTFGLLALAAERSSSGSLIVLAAPLGAFFWDATITLFRRLARGERVYLPHRTHLYQQLVQNGWSHRRVSLLYAGLTVALGMLATVGRLRPSAVAALLAGFVLIPLLGGWAALRFTSRPHARG